MSAFPPASLAERTRALCALSSPIGHEQELCDALQAWAEGVFPSPEVRRFGHSLVLGPLEPGSIALVGHLDTVPAHPGEGPPRIEGGRVYGLGASDMKGGLAVMMALAEQAQGRRPLLVLYEREEGPYTENGLEPLFEAVPALAQLGLAICLEPTDGELQVGCLGSLHATVTFAGQRAHAARPWQGDNAIHRAGALLGELHGRERVRVEREGLAFYEVLSATTAQGGQARNVVPDRFELNLNYRFAPGKSVEQAQQEVEAFVAGRAQVAFTDLSPSGRVCLDNPRVQRFLTQSKVALSAKQAWTDVARFAVRGVDAVNFGPGDTAQAHQANESASVDALERAFALLKAFLEGA